MWPCEGGGVAEEGCEGGRRAVWPCEGGGEGMCGLVRWEEDCVAL